LQHSKLGSLMSVRGQSRCLRPRRQRRSFPQVPESGPRFPWGPPPISQPTKYEIGLNLRTAKELGIEIPPSLLVQANEVIEGGTAARETNCVPRQRTSAQSRPRFCTALRLFASVVCLVQGIWLASVGPTHRSRLRSAIPIPHLRPWGPGNQHAPIRYPTRAFRISNRSVSRLD
jgi:hypothetical protein